MSTKTSGHRVLRNVKWMNSMPTNHRYKRWKVMTSLIFCLRLKCSAIIYLVHKHIFVEYQDQYWYSYRGLSVGLPVNLFPYLIRIIITRENGKCFRSWFRKGYIHAYFQYYHGTYISSDHIVITSHVSSISLLNRQAHLRDLSRSNYYI